MSQAESCEENNLIEGKTRKMMRLNFKNNSILKNKPGKRYIYI
jgi:hypothetical protein